MDFSYSTFLGKRHKVEVIGLYTQIRGNVVADRMQPTALFISEPLLVFFSVRTQVFISFASPLAIWKRNKFVILMDSKKRTRGTRIC